MSYISIESHHIKVWVASVLNPSVCVCVCVCVCTQQEEEGSDEEGSRPPGCLSSTGSLLLKRSQDVPEATLVSPLEEVRVLPPLGVTMATLHEASRCVCVCVCMSVCICVCVCVSVFVCVR